MIAIGNDTSLKIDNKKQQNLRSDLCNTLDYM